MKLLQITDTHLSPAKAQFIDNWEPLARWIAEIGPDLIVHTGDLSVDGADHEADLAFAIELIRRLPVPVLCVPGNHDVGHLPGSPQPVDAARLKRWRALVGPDRWVEDHGDWRLLGIDGLLCGSGTGEEAEQFAWLERSLAERDGRRVALFSHQPLFVDDPDEGDTGYWGIPPAPRRALRDLFARHDVALFASGHLHVAASGRLDETALVWAPATSFMVGPMQREMPGRRMLGAVIHRLETDVSSEIVAIPGLSQHFLDDVVEQVYPRLDTGPVPTEPRA
ncbi:MAG: metallophosphoesterase family protein [Janthinobacterium lividum]